MAVKLDKKLLFKLQKDEESIEPGHLKVEKYQVRFQSDDHFAALQTVLALSNQFDFIGMIGQEFFSRAVCSSSAIRVRYLEESVM